MRRSTFVNIKEGFLFSAFRCYRCVVVQSLLYAIFRRGGFRFLFIYLRVNLQKQVWFKGYARPYFEYFLNLTETRRKKFIVLNLHIGPSISLCTGFQEREWIKAAVKKLKIQKTKNTFVNSCSYFSIADLFGLIRNRIRCLDEYSYNFVTSCNIASFI